MQHLRFASLPGRTANFHAAITRLSPGTETAVHRHDYFEVFLVTGGRGTHRWRDREIGLRRGMLVFLRPQDHHAFATGPGQELVFINIAFGLGTWRHLVALCDPPLKPQAFARLAEPFHLPLPELEASALARELEALLAAHRLEPWSLAAALLPAVIHLSRAAAQPAVQSIPDWLDSLRKSIESSPRLDMDIAYWQRKSGRSPEHLARSCRAHFGMTLTELINRARIDLVKRRLRAGDHKLHSVALECGFRNLSHFHRLFRRHTGLTPRQWMHLPSASIVPRQ